jgi:ABC-type Fe3+/spermidine/putrescine transport system ATPase subunit
MIAGHEAVSAGDIIIGPANVTDLPPARRGTAMMFQSYALFPHLDCIDNVAFSLKMRGTDKVARRARARELLRLVAVDGCRIVLADTDILPKSRLGRLFQCGEVANGDSSAWR